METDPYSSQTGLNSEEVRSQILVSTLMTQALIRLQEQTPWVNSDVRERADREENIGVEGGTSKQLCAAFFSCDPKTSASISRASISIQTEASRRITVMHTRESRVICKRCLPQHRQSTMRSQLSQSQGLGCYAAWAKSWSQWSRGKLCQWEHNLSFSPHLWLPHCWKHSEFANDSNGKEREQISHIPSLLVLFP